MANRKFNRKINLDELKTNPDAIYDLLDEIGSDFEFDSNDDDTWEPEPETRTAALLVSDESDSESESANERNSPGPSSSNNKISWKKQNFNSKPGPTDDINQLNEVLTPWGYFSRYLGDDFFELGANLTARYYLQGNGRELKKYFVACMLLWHAWVA